MNYLKLLFISGMASLLAVALSSFSVNGNEERNGVFKTSLKLQMSGESGTNGAGVAYNPGKKLYYAVFAGNMDYPVTVFDAKGKNKECLVTTAGFDARSFWYNKKTNNIMGLCFSEGGVVKFQLNNQGLLSTGPETIKEGLFQPSEQAVGSYNEKSDEMYFLNTSTGMTEVWSTSQWGTLKRSFKINCTMNSNNTSISEDYNTSLIYTGIKKKEIALLNVPARAIEFYNEANGDFTERKSLPKELDFDLRYSFNFSYANKMFWIFNINNRTWYNLK